MNLRVINDNSIVVFISVIIRRPKKETLTRVSTGASIYF